MKEPISASTPDFKALLTGRTAVVTGASSGLGRHFAVVLAGAGATVVAVARRIALLDELAGEVEGVVACAADVTTPSGRDLVVEAALAAGPEFSILINNAGGAGATPAIELELAAFETTLQLNLVSTFALSQLAARHMPNGGSIVNIASMFGLVASAPITQAAYCAASGRVGLTCQLGLRMGALRNSGERDRPSAGSTANSRQSSLPEKGAAFIRRETPMDRVGRMDELDGPLLLLASDLGSFITGQTIAVDGGWTAR
jgi:hypothetical protein